MRDSFTSKVFSKPPCVQKSIRPLAWGIGYCASECTDFYNYTFAIKQGGLEKTLEV